MTNFASAGVFALAAITDWLDGWVARRYHQHSAFGAFLDPVADKLMVAVALFLIVQGHPTPWMAFWAAVIVGREIAVSALREWMAEIGQRAKVRVAAIGKIKTTAQMVALLFLLYSVTPGQMPTHEIWLGNLIFRAGYWTLAIAALLTLCRVSSICRPPGQACAPMKRQRSAASRKKSKATVDSYPVRCRISPPKRE